MDGIVRTLIIENAERRADGIDELIAAAGGSGRVCRIYLGEELPPASDFEAIIISGGPMGVYEMHQPPYDFLKREADFLDGILAKGKAVLGICLGHQLLAHILGGHVEVAPEQSEAGWSTITLHKTAAGDPLFFGLPEEFWSFQHHNDAVTRLPAGATPLAGSPRCAIQAFRYSARPVWGVQFHPEMSPEKAQSFLELRRERLEAKGIDVSLAIQQGFSVAHAPRKQIFYNFIQASAGDPAPKV